MGSLSSHRQRAKKYNGSWEENAQKQETLKTHICHKNLLDHGA